MNLILNSKFLILICGAFFVFWLIAVILWQKEKGKSKVLKKNSGWSTDKAREKAEGIIQEAKNAALKELSDVKLETDKYEKELEAGVKSLTEQEISQYKEIIGNISEDVEEGVKKQSEEYKIQFDIAWKKMVEEMQVKIQEDYTLERKKIEEYTGVKMREIEEKITGMADEAVLEVLKKQVDAQVTKGLIMEAIETVKKKYGV